MSYDLAVFDPALLRTEPTPGALYARLLEEENVAQHTSHEPIESFYRRLIRRYPEINSLPEEEVDDSPWASRIGKGLNSIVLSISHARASEVAAFVCMLAGEFGLVCYDPQQERILDIERVSSNASVRLSRATLYRQGLQAIQAVLGPYGYAKKFQGLFAKQISPGVWGCIGLPETTTEEGIVVWPVVGVRHDVIELLIERFTGRHQQWIGSVNWDLELLMGRRISTTWFFMPNGDHRSVASDLAAAIKQWGDPFMMGASQLRGLCDTLEKLPVGWQNQQPMVLPIAYALLGETDRARGIVKDTLAKYRRQRMGLRNRVSQVCQRFPCLVDVRDQIVVLLPRFVRKSLSDLKQRVAAQSDGGRCATTDSMGVWPVSAKQTFRSSPADRKFAAK